MMAGPALPAAQGAMPAGFAAFVAGIGQVSPEGDAAGFDRLLAAAPTTSAPAAATTDAMPVPVAGAVAAVVATEIGAALAAESQGAAKAEVKAEGQGEAHGDEGEPPVVPTPAKVATPAKASPARPEIGAGEAAVLAANLLVALSGAVPGPPAKTAKAVDTDAAAQPDAEPSDTAPAAPPPSVPAPCVPTLSVPATPGTAALVVTAALPETLPLDPAPAKATKPAATEAQPAARALVQPKATTTTPATPPEALPAASPAPRARVAAPPPLAPPADAPVAKTGDAGAAPAMTILFTQSAAPAIAAPVAAGAPAAIAERVLDMDSDGAWIDQLARDIAATKSDSGDISFRLMPRHLGRLDVAMRQGDEGVTLKMETQHEATATIVTAAQGRLVDELRQQGVRVAGAEVTHTPGDTGRQSTGQGQGRAAPPDPAHLIETATERGEDRPKTDSEDRAANRRGRFA